MKKILLILIIFIVSCDKKKPILGERKDIFLNNSSIQIEGNIKNIKITEPDTLNNYYGDSSILNNKIENYKVKSLNFNKFDISNKKFSVKNYFFSSPIIVDDIVYYIDTNGNLIAKNMKNNANKILWKSKVIDKHNFMNYYGAKISYYNDVIFITSRLNDIVAVSKNGILKWKKKLNTIPISSPVIEGTTVYIITNDNKLYALDTEDGKIKWINYGTPKDSAILGSANPVVYNNFVIASYSSGELVILNKLTSEVVFNTNLTGKYSIFSNFELTDIDSTPIIKDGIMIATANNGITIAVDLNSMKILWKQNLPSLTNILINNNFLYLITTDNIVVCLNLKNGQINWFKELDKYSNIIKKKGILFYKSLLLINSKLYAFNNIGQAKVVDPNNGKFIKTITLPFIFYNIPFSVNDKLYGIGLEGRKIELIKSK